MSQVCKEFDVNHMTTLELLHHLICWQRDNDEPRGWKQRYGALFGAPAPQLTVR